MKYFDYIFFRIYDYLKRRKIIQNNQEAFFAMGCLFFFIFIPIVVVCGYFDIFSSVLHLTEKYELIALFSVWWFPIHYRYCVSEKITQGDYRHFRERWGNEPADIRHRRSWIILIMCIVNIILVPILPIVLSMLHHFFYSA